MAFDPQRTAQPGEINYALVDRWTLGHIAVGAVFGALGAPLWAAGAAGVAWELIERQARARLLLHSANPDLYHAQDTLQNSVGDVAGNMIGWWLGQQLRGQ